MKRLLPFAILGSTILAALLVIIIQPRETMLQKKRLREMRQFLLAQAGPQCPGGWQSWWEAAGRSCSGIPGQCIPAGYSYYLPSDCEQCVADCYNASSRSPSGSSSSGSGSSSSNESGSAPSIGRTIKTNNYISILLYESPAGDGMREGDRRFSTLKTLDAIAACVLGITTGKTNPSEASALETANKTIERAAENAIRKTPAEHPLGYLTRTENILCSFNEKRGFDYLAHPQETTAELTADLAALAEPKKTEVTVEKQAPIEQQKQPTTLAEPLTPQNIVFRAVNAFLKTIKINVLKTIRSLVPERFTVKTTGNPKTISNKELKLWFHNIRFRSSF